MKDWGFLRLRALELLREDWKSPRELARELGIDIGDAKALLKEFEEKRLVWRDGPLYVAREGRL